MSALGREKRGPDCAVSVTDELLTLINLHQKKEKTAGYWKNHEKIQLKKEVCSRRGDGFGRAVDWVIGQKD